MKQYQKPALSIDSLAAEKSIAADGVIPYAMDGEVEISVPDLWGDYN